MNEIVTQCQFALDAYKEIMSTISLYKDSEKEPNIDYERPATDRKLFRNIHSFLTHAANLSKLFWIFSREPKSEAVERAEALRKLLGISEDHLLKNRSFRNNLDHFDERLDSWAISSKHHSAYFTDLLGRPQPFLNSVIKEKDLMRLFDHETMTFYFQGDPCNIQSIAESIDILLKIAQEKGGRGPGHIWFVAP
jgi:hypothetical protein